MKPPTIRTSWIDIARGIGILLVLYGHVLGSDKTRFFIYAFHMPLFFFVSGLVFKERHTASFITFLWKNVKQILIPYIFFALVSLVTWRLFIEPTTKHTIMTSLTNILYGNGIYPSLEWNAPLWFLPCFFLTKTVYGGILKYIKRTTFRYVTLLFLAISGYIFMTYFPTTKLPFSAEVACTSIVFFGLGHLSNYNQSLKKLLGQMPLQIAIFSLTLTYLFARANFIISGHQVDMRINQFNNILLFYLGAFSGICLVIAASYILKQNKILEYIGRNTLILFAWHYPLYLIITKYINTFSFSKNETIKLFFPTVYTIFAIVLIMLVYRYYKKMKLLFIHSSPLHPKR